MASSSAGAAAERSASVVHLAFNPYANRFIAATATGVHVFSCDPFRRVFCEDVEVYPDSTTSWKVAIAEMLNEAFVAVVFRGAKPNGGGFMDRIFFWSVLGGRMYGMEKRLPFDVVSGFRLVGEYLLVAGDEKTVLYEMAHHAAVPTKVKVVDTAHNPLGLCAVAQPDGLARSVLVSPQKNKGMLQVHRLGEHPIYLRAHYSTVVSFALSHDGRLLATAGSKGTLVRIFSTNDGKLLQEVRRGTDRADIHCIAFSPDSKWLAVSSDKCTVHVFRVNVDSTSSGSAPKNGSSSGHGSFQEAAAPSPAANASQGSYLSFLKGLLPGYFRSERSWAQVYLREDVKYLVAFGRQRNTVLVIGMDGSFYRCQFDPEIGGEMKQLEYRNFMDIKG
ncbi:hypothetical protein ABZP36_001826 [Zizania latifolia]